METAMQQMIPQPQILDRIELGFNSVSDRSMFSSGLMSQNNQVQ